MSHTCAHALAHTRAPIHVHTVCEPIYTHIYTPHTCHIHKEKCSDSFENFMRKLIFLYVVSKVYRWEAEEVGWCSRSLYRRPEDVGSVLSTYIRQLTTIANSSPRGLDALFCPLGASACIQCAYIHSRQTHACTHT